eukprot:10029787-Prorocentrum_lima.AAC.1
METLITASIADLIPQMNRTAMHHALPHPIHRPCTNLTTYLSRRARNRLQHAFNGNPPPIAH